MIEETTPKSPITSEQSTDLVSELHQEDSVEAARRTSQRVQAAQLRQAVKAGVDPMKALGLEPPKTTEDDNPDKPAVKTSTVV